jgi:hypothetical protein
MWIEWLEASLIILCMYFVYRGCYQDYITYTSEIPSRKNKRVTVKTKNDTKDEEDAGTSPSDNSIVNNSSTALTHLQPRMPGFHLLTIRL